MSEPLLLLCPFCGTPPQLGMHKSSVWCKESSCWLFNKTIGIEKWNTRTPPQSAMKCEECETKMDFYIRTKKPSYFECPDCGKTVEVKND